ncbi:uncharacterized protein EI97DRAFT_445526 [Westerdykella ornata]|uniref:Uncharacterized protein n=1 Tax=Westerdykella ornata TaxID=318751 RepID=A0A6A6J8Q9_WESOR|nr:uncharacterized protein EI97DRAFT_445526 [Westerdykella ornata]KAF2272755.1 hypothetical protein EI97DRAFT_445526 [Westerdykella ornata]
MVESNFQSRTLEMGIEEFLDGVQSNPDLANLAAAMNRQRQAKEEEERAKEKEHQRAQKQGLPRNKNPYYSASGSSSSGGSGSAGGHTSGPSVASEYHYPSFFGKTSPQAGGQDPKATKKDDRFSREAAGHQPFDPSDKSRSKQAGSNDGSRRRS